MRGDERRGEGDRVRRADVEDQPAGNRLAANANAPAEVRLLALHRQRHARAADVRGRMSAQVEREPFVRVVDLDDEAAEKVEPNDGPTGIPYSVSSPFSSSTAACLNGTRSTCRFARKNASFGPASGRVNATVSFGLNSTVRRCTSLRDGPVREWAFRGTY
jgi:hypothetical protein